MHLIEYILNWIKFNLEHFSLTTEFSLVSISLTGIIEMQSANYLAVKWLPYGPNYHYFAFVLWRSATLSNAASILLWSDSDPEALPSAGCQSCLHSSSIVTRGTGCNLSHQYHQSPTSSSARSETRYSSWRPPSSGCYSPTYDSPITCHHPQHTVLQLWASRATWVAYSCQLTESSTFAAEQEAFIGRMRRISPGRSVVGPSLINFKLLVSFFLLSFCRNLLLLNIINFK